jgi:hypothetical protein
MQLSLQVRSTLYQKTISLAVAKEEQLSYVCFLVSSVA